ncbi:MAG: aminotransferase class III-fold pyridoxal phosphate-dependent enzyme [Chloroflexi bacterium]|nr:aminotransferase class III-fold pyridoxal phosphate-dependent enzyme [Chloroflexota bacterium]
MGADGNQQASSTFAVTESLRLWEEAQRLIPGGSQTNSKRPQNYALGKYPIYASHAEGCRIWDVDGNEYVDYVNGLGPISLGYRFPAVDDAIRAQLDRGIISGLLWPLEVEAARALVETIPCAEMVRFLKGGGEATAAAARIARAYTGRHLLLNAGYRGWPDTWSAGRDPAVPPDLAKYVVSFPSHDLDKLASLLDQHRGQVAAVCMDAPHSDVLPSGHLAAIRDLAHAHGALFMMDEIVNGFRLAPGGAHEHYGVLPDLACFAKGMANGMPLAAVVGRREVMQAAADALISVTYGGEALSLAACVATVRVYREQNVTAHLWAMGRRLMEGLDAAAREAGVPFRCAGQAPISAMRFDLPSEQVAPAWELWLAECAKRGVLIRRGGLNFVTYSHTSADIDQTIDACAQAFRVLRDAGYTAAGGQPGQERQLAGAVSGRGQQIGL